MPSDLPTVTTTEEAETEATPNEAELAILELIDTVSLASSDFSIDRAASVVRATGLGTTLILQVCAVPGPEFNERLSIVMHAVVNVAEDIPVEIEAVAVGLLNCADPDANLRIIGVQVSLILQFANEEIEARDFQRGWQPLS